MYPVIQYLYNLASNLTTNGCPYTRIYLPGMPGYSSSYDSQPVNMVVKQISDLVSQIALNERKYIN
jgi:hypothetical protein